MKLLLVYGTTEGQTAKIAQHVFGIAHQNGHSVALERADGDDPVSPTGFDAAIVAGSIHAGRYQEPLVDYVRTHSDALAAMPTLFLSVSLTAAGDDAEDWEELQACVTRFSEETGWTPDRVEHIAGAFKFTDYGFFTYWAMRWIAKSKGQDVGRHENREYTDWDRLKKIVEDWSATAAAS